MVGHKDSKFWFDKSVDDFENSKLQYHIICSVVPGTGSPAPLSPDGGAGFSHLKTVLDHFDLVNWDLHLQVSFHLSFAFPYEQKLGTFAKSMNWQVTSEPSWVAGWILTSSCWLKHSHALIQISIGETSWSWKAQGSLMWTKARGAVVSVPFTCHRPAVVSISGHREKHSVREMETLWNVWWWVWYSP